MLRSGWRLAAVAGAGLILAAGATRYPFFDAAVVPLAAGLLLLLAVCHVVRPEDNRVARRVLRLSLAAFVAHAAIGIVINQSPTLIQYLGGDAVTYDQGARMIVAHWHDASVPLPPMGGGKEGFYYAVGGLYWIFGAYPIAGLALNAFFASALVPLLYDLTRRLVGPEAGWWAAVIVTVQPGFLVWTSQLLREAGVIFFLAVGLACTLRLAARASPRPALVLAIDLSLLFTFRADVGLVAAAGLAAGLILGRKHVAGALVTAVLVLGMVGVLVGAVGVGRAGYRASTKLTLQDVSAARANLAGTGASGFARAADVSTPARALGFLPTGLPSFLLGPFPWQIRNARQVLGALEALTVLTMAWFGWHGWRRARHDLGRRRLVLVLPAAALAVSLTLLIGNYGTVVRERLQLLVFVIPLVALGYSSRRPGRDPRDAAISGSPTGAAAQPASRREEARRAYEPNR
jgi:Dolichyl-phosphate-mannose-protein mannosyltransferase